MSKIDLVLTAADRNKAEAPVLRRFRPGYGWLGLATVAVLLLIWIVARRWRWSVRCSCHRRKRYLRPLPMPWPVGSTVRRLPIMSP